MIITPQIAKVAYSVPLLYGKIGGWHQDSKTQLRISLLFGINSHVYCCSFSQNLLCIIVIKKNKRLNLVLFLKEKKSSYRAIYIALYGS